jgi:hypothetical protein
MREAARVLVENVQDYTDHADLPEGFILATYADGVWVVRADTCDMNAMSKLVCVLACKPWERETISATNGAHRVSVWQVTPNNWRMDIEARTDVGAWRDYDSAQGYATRDAALMHASSYFGIHTGESSAEKRETLITASRSRAASLRTRAWSEQALDHLAFHAFALTCDKDGNATVLRAADELAAYLRDSPSDITNARDAFRSLYGIARDYARAARKQAHGA